MQFTGRIMKVLEARSGVSQRTGNEWKALPFVFEYFENPTDRYSDKVVLETFDTNLMNLIKEGATATIGFGHNVREYEGKYYNELRAYNIQIGAAPVAQPTGQAATPAPNGTGTVAQQPAQQATAPFPPAVDANGQPTNDGGQTDDLPF